MPDLSINYCHLDTTAVISVSGPDSRAFLHALLTQDIDGLAAGRGTHAAWLDAKGRLRALFELLPQADGFRLLTPHQTAQATVDKIRLFVLRTKVKLEIDNSVAVFALLGNASNWLAESGIPLGAEPYQTCRHAECSWMRVGPGIIRVTGELSTLRRLFESLRPSDTAAVDLAEIALGLPSVTPNLEGRYTAHMLSLDRLGAVSFDKGCYPGQEIVARTQNLGKVKRRIERFHAESGSAPDIDTALVDSKGERVGEVIRSATAKTGFEVLAVVRLDRPPGPIFVDGDPTPLNSREIVNR